MTDDELREMRNQTPLCNQCENLIEELVPVIDQFLALRAAVRREREADDSRSYDIETYVAARALVDRLVAGEKE